MAGATAAVDFIAGLAPSGGSRRDRLVAAHQLIEEHELRLRRRIEEGLAIFHNRLTVHSVAADRTPTLFLTFRDKDAADAYRFLAARDVLAPAGTFYAYEPFRALNLEVDAGLRSVSPPTTTTPRSTACSAPLRSSCTRIDRDS